MSVLRPTLGLWIVLTLGVGMGHAALQTSDIPVSEDYILRIWNQDDGIGGNDVLSIAQSGDGYLWLATGTGLIRFDGVRFSSVATGLPNERGSYRLNLLYGAKDGDLWLAYDNGAIARRQSGRIVSIVPPRPAASPCVTVDAVTQDGQGDLWFGYASSLGALRWRNGTISWLRRDAGLEILDHVRLRTATTGRMWFTNPHSTGFWNGERFQPVDQNDGSRTILASGRDGAMWVARGSDLLRYWEDGTRETVADISAMGGGDKVEYLLEDRSGTLWIATRGRGLFCLAGVPASGAPQPTEKTLPGERSPFVRVPTSNPYISTLFEDREGNLWAGTRGGLNRLRPRFLFLRQSGDGLLDDNALSVALDVENRLWVVGITPAVRATDAQGQTFLPVAGSPTALLVTHADPEGNVWLAGTSGLWRWKNGIFDRAPLAVPVATMFRDPEGWLWVASIDGPLFRYRDDRPPLPIADPKLKQSRAITADSAGTIWVGTETGLVLRKSPGEEDFKPVSLPEARPEQEPVRFIVPDENNTVWIGTLAGGIYRHRGGEVKRLPSAAGLPLTDVRSLIPGRDGNLWIGTERSLLRVDRRAFDAAFEGKGPIRFFSYELEEGLSNVVFNFGFLSAPTVTSEGHLWFGTSRGALEVRPERLPPPPPPPLPLLIEEVRVNDQPQSINRGQALTIAPHPGTVSISFTLPRFHGPEKLRFYYRLSGDAPGNWTSMDTLRTAAFSRLQPGDYRFEAAALDDRGKWLPNPATLDFTVEAAWSQTWTFRVISVLVAVFIFYLIVRQVERRRVRSRLRELERERALEQERARIARDMHDELGSSLTRIAQMSDLALAGAGPSARHVSEIADAARAVSSTLDRIVWTVDPGNDTLDNLVGYINEFITEYLAASTLEVEITLPERTPPAPVASRTRHQVLLILKEALNNILKHARATRVTCTVGHEDHHLKVTLSDDGRGFDRAKLARSGHGLANMSERAFALGGHARIESSPGSGTTVVFSVPLSPKTTVTTLPT